MTCPPKVLISCEPVSRQHCLYDLYYTLDSIAWALTLAEMENHHIRAKSLTSLFELYVILLLSFDILICLLCISNRPLMMRTDQKSF